MWVAAAFARPSGSLQKIPSAPDFPHYTKEAGTEYSFAWTGIDAAHHLKVARFELA